MATSQQLNRDLALRLLDEAARDPECAYRGKFIGIAKGQVVSVSEDWRDAVGRLHAAESEAANTYLLQINRDGREVITLKSFPGVVEPRPERPALTTDQQRNQDAADELIAQAKRDPHSPYQGKFVGIVNGQIVVVADDLDNVARRLDEIEPDPNKTFCLEIGPDYDKVYEIWEIN